MGALVEGAVGSVPPGPDGERVGVVGQDRPLSPDLPALVAFQAGAVQPVAAFEVTDPALRTRSVASHPTLGALRAGLLAASDEHGLGVKVLERGAGRTDVEATVERDLAWADPESFELGDGLRQQRVLGRVPQLGRGRQDQTSGAASGVLGHLRQLGNEPKFVGLPKLPLADRPRVWIVQRHDPILDRLPGHALADLPRDLLAAIGHLLQRRGRLELRLCPAPARVAPGDLSEPACLADRALQQLAGLARQLQDLLLGLPGAATDRAGDRPELVAHRPRPVAHPRLLLADQFR